MQTESIDKLAAALSKAQGEIGGATKGSVNPHFKSRYADLASVVEAVREPFAKNGLAYQQPYRNNDGQLCIVTRIIHTSGQWVEDDGVPLLLSKQDMQGLGSASTYARRYGLMAAAGVAPEDDDGNAAVGESRGTAKPVPVKRGTAKRGTPAIKIEVPAEPGLIPVPAPSNGSDMKVVWQTWCKAFLETIDACDDVSAVNAWMKANADVLKNLAVSSTAAYQHIENTVKAKRGTLAQAPAQAAE